MYQKFKLTLAAAAAAAMLAPAAMAQEFYQIEQHIYGQHPASKRQKNHADRAQRRGIESGGCDD